MTPHAFVEKWRAIDLPEPVAAQMHFLDLCALLGQPGPGSAAYTSSAFNRARKFRFEPETDFAAARTVSAVASQMK